MYIIKITYTSTDKNDRFAPGTQIVYYFGRNDTTLGRANELPLEWELNRHAFTRLAGAKTALRVAVEHATFEERFGFWNVTPELIKVDLRLLREWYGW